MLKAKDVGRGSVADDTRETNTPLLGEESVAEFSQRGDPSRSGFICKKQHLPSAEGHGNGDLWNKDRDQCQAACAAKNTCNGFAWDSRGKKCHLKRGFDVSKVSWRTGGWKSRYDFCYKGAIQFLLNRTFL